LSAPGEDKVGENTNLEVSMDDVQRMYILDATKHLELKEDKSQGRIVRRINFKAILRRPNISLLDF